MHILTKIFVVLVALLAVATVPFVIVQASNESTYRTNYIEQKSAAQSAHDELGAVRASMTRTESDLQAQLAAADTARAKLAADLEAKGADLMRSMQDAERLKAQAAQRDATFAVLAESDRSRGVLVESLANDLGEMRDRAVAAERQLMEVQKQLEVIASDFDAARSAQMALQEQLQRLREAKATATARVAAAELVAADAMARSAALGASGSSAELPEPQPAPETAGVQPTIELEARITAVRRDGDTVYAEIDQGSRAGIANGWRMMIADGNNYIADLRIISVDTNSAVGIVEGESALRGSVEDGQSALAQPD
ncbi:MAG: hypothetical protein O2819_07120 [Planctomycetota bacterium]|nr:hypothetical protein [Planctomycetota bacterium]MDA1106056.1 hypothetical protein [Planctomycetota bacterium]